MLDWVASSGVVVEGQRHGFFRNSHSELLWGEGNWRPWQCPILVRYGVAAWIPRCVFGLACRGFGYRETPRPSFESGRAELPLGNKENRPHCRSGLRAGRSRSGPPQVHDGSIDPSLLGSRFVFRPRLDLALWRVAICA